LVLKTIEIYFFTVLKSGSPKFNMTKPPVKAEEENFPLPLQLPVTPVVLFHEAA
jgi:hypothetical protein